MLNIQKQIKTKLRCLKKLLQLQAEKKLPGNKKIHKSQSQHQRIVSKTIVNCILLVRQLSINMFCTVKIVSSLLTRTVKQIRNHGPTRHN